MIKILFASMLFVVVMLDYTEAKFYSRARLEKWVADSLKRVDSLRVADSLRIADSLTVVRYEASDSMLAREKRQEAAAEIKIISSIADTAVIPIPGQVDITSGRVVVVAPNNPYAKTIDGLQKKIDSMNNCIHDNDGRFKEMKTFPISEKKRYMLFLLQNKLKDSSAVLSYCNALVEVYKVKHELLLAIKKSQDANTKSFIQYHIDEHKKKMADLNNFILALTPKVPFLPQPAVQKRILEQ